MAWPRDAYVGQKVVCTNKTSKWGDSLGTNKGPRFGDVCEINSIEIVGQEAFFRFVGYPFFSSYLATEFRPVQKHLRSTETGIRILKEIAARKREPEGVEA